MVMYAALIAFRRDLHTVVMLLGQLLNEASSIVVKDLVAASKWRHWSVRPPGSDKTDAGMPSSHTQFIFFFCTYSALFVWRRVRIERPQAKPLLCLGLEFFALAVGFSRFHLQYHTAEQCFAGAALGVGCGAAWFATVGQLRPSFAGWEQWGPLRFFHFKDTSHVDFLHRFEKLNAQRLRELTKKGH